MYICTIYFNDYSSLRTHFEIVVHNIIQDGVINATFIVSSRMASF